MATFTNTTNNALVSGTSSADSITNYGYKVTITTAEGDDTVNNIYDETYGSSSAESVSIDTGAGNDSVYNNGDNATINTGAGNDYVYQLNITSMTPASYTVAANTNLHLIDIILIMKCSSGYACSAESGWLTSFSVMEASCKCKFTCSSYINNDLIHYNNALLRRILVSNMST